MITLNHELNTKTQRIECLLLLDIKETKKTKWLSFTLNKNASEALVEIEKNLIKIQEEDNENINSRNT